MSAPWELEWAEDPAFVWVAAGQLLLALGVREETVRPLGELRSDVEIVDAAKNEAIAEANRQKELAQAEIEAAATRAREDLRKQVSALAVSGAEKLLKREIDANAHKALLDELAAEI